MHFLGAKVLLSRLFLWLSICFFPFLLIVRCYAKLLIFTLFCPQYVKNAIFCEKYFALSELNYIFAISFFKISVFYEIAHEVGSILHQPLFLLCDFLCISLKLFTFVLRSVKMLLLRHSSCFVLVSGRYYRLTLF